MAEVGQGLPPVNFPTLGWQVVDWIEAMLVHGPGDVQGDDIHVDDEMALHICWLYRVYPQGHPMAGRRLIHRGIQSRPKGRAKSETAGEIVCVEALGPVRCDGFDANGDPVGVPVRYPFIRCMATEEEQSGNTYDNVYYMLSEGEVANRYAIDPGITRTFIKEPGGGEITPSTSGSASKDGGKETFAVADETHLYHPPALRTMYRTVARNTGKRKIAEPWMYDTTTMFEVGENSIAEQAHQRYAHLEIEDAVEKYGVLYDHRQGDKPKIFGSDASLIKAMKAGYGPAASWMDFSRIVKIIRDSEDPETEAYRYYLNRPRKSANAWLAPEEVLTVLADFEPEKGEAITLGFDGSESDDHTVLFGCRENGDLFVIGAWAPRPDEPRWREDVSEAVEWAHSYFRVVKAYGDPPWWQEEMGKWSIKWRTKDDKPIWAAFWTNQDTKMGVACGALRTAVRQPEDSGNRVRINPVPIRTEELSVGSDNVARPGSSGKTLIQWHFENARTRKVRIKLDDKAEEAFIVRKERPGSALKIDAVPSAVLARRARDDAAANGEFEQRVYARAAWQ